MGLSENSLGKSLTSVFARTTRRDTPVSRGYLEVDINLLMPSASNPRTHADEQALQELSTSIKRHGVLQPIIVVRKEGGYEIVAGERRYRAANLAGLTTVPVVIKEDLDDKAMAELRLIENIQREDLDPIELAKAFQQLIDHHKLSHEEIAEQVGKDRTSITNSLRLLTLPEEVQSLTASGRLSMGHARALAGLKDVDRCTSIARQVVDRDLTVRATENLVRSSCSDSSPASRTERPAHIRELEENLSRLFASRVVITERSGKGKLVIHFHSRAHFRTVIETLDHTFQHAQQTPTSSP